MVDKSKKSKNAQSKQSKLKQEEKKVEVIKKTKKRRKNYKKINLKNIIENKKLIAIFAFTLIITIYCAYKVIVLIQNPTDTFSVEQGKIYQEEGAVRIYYKRRNCGKRCKL